MKFIFLSNVCSNEEYKYIQSIKFKNKINPSQKYFDMLFQGFLKMEDVYLTCITARSIDPSNSNVDKLSRKTEIISERQEFRYTEIICKKIIKNIINFINGYRYTIKAITEAQIKNEKVVVICDPLIYDLSAGAILASKLKKISLGAVVTDLPTYLEETNTNKKLSFKSKLRAFLNNSILQSFDVFCFLTESMNIVNKKGKKYVIAEGMVCDGKEKITSNHVEENIVIYAGGLYEKFGINKLVDACKDIKIPGFQLHLYGEGTSLAYIKSVCNQNPNIKYMGVVSLEEIYEAEKKAKLLINPRPSDEAFTKYSFPSKTMEYMSTARPVLSTKLKGIPDEYFNYIYKIKNESVVGIKESIELILSKKDEELDVAGNRAYDFVYREKNSIVQAKKIRSLFE